MRKLHARRVARLDFVCKALRSTQKWSLTLDHGPLVPPEPPAILLRASAAERPAKDAAFPGSPIPRSSRAEYARAPRASGEVVEKETDALIADQARRASAARAISAVFVVLTFVGSVPSVLLGRSWPTALVQLATSACLATIWWRSRHERLSATRTGMGLVVVILLEVTLSAIVAPHPGDAVQISYLISLTPFLAAITLRSRGVIVTDPGRRARARRRRLPRAAAGWQPFVTNFFYFAAASTAALFGSLASERALRALASEEARARAARARARNAEARYQLVSEHVSDLVSVHDEEGRFVYVSPAHQRVLGIDPKELLGKSTPEFIHPEDLPLLSASFRKTLVEGKARGRDAHPHGRTAATAGSTSACRASTRRRVKAGSSRSARGTSPSNASSPRRSKRRAAWSRSVASPAAWRTTSTTS